MEVEILSVVPEEWKAKKPIETYVTTFLYVGFSRYDTAKQVLSNFQQTDGVVRYNERSLSETCFARCYVAEHARVTVYSQSPRIWKEEADTTHFFLQKQAIQPA